MLRDKFTSTNQKHFPDLGCNTRHQYGISLFVFQTSFHGETSCDVAKFRLSFHSASIVLLLKTIFRHWECFLPSLLLRMAGMDMDWNLKMLDEILKFFWYYFVLKPKVTGPFKKRVPGYGPKWIFQFFSFPQLQNFATLRSRKKTTIKFPATQVHARALKNLHTYLHSGVKLCKIGIYHLCSDLFPSLHKFASYLRWANLKQIHFLVQCCSFEFLWQGSKIKGQSIRLLCFMTPFCIPNDRCNNWKKTGFIHDQGLVLFYDVDQT